MITLKIYWTFKAMLSTSIWCKVFIVWAFITCAVILTLQWTIFFKILILRFLSFDIDILWIWNVIVFCSIILVNHRNSTLRIWSCILIVWLSISHHISVSISIEWFELMPFKSVLCWTNSMTPWVWRSLSESSLMILICNWFPFCCNIFEFFLWCLYCFLVWWKFLKVVSSSKTSDSSIHTIFNVFCIKI